MLGILHQAYALQVMNGGCVGRKYKIVNAGRGASLKKPDNPGSSSALRCDECNLITKPIHQLVENETVL